MYYPRLRRQEHPSHDRTGSDRRRSPCQSQADRGAAQRRIFRGFDRDERRRCLGTLRQRQMRHCFARCDDAWNGWVGSLPPVVMVTALDQPSSLLHGFEAGADDFLSSPIDELALLARVKSLSRSRFALDELRSQALRSVNLGIGFPLSRAMESDGSGGRIMIAEDSPASAELIANALRRFHDVECIHDQDRVLDSAALGNYDLFIVSLDLTGYDGLRFCTRLRSMERTRQIPVLAIADPKDRQRILRGFDLGVNDYVPRPVDPGELAARARAQIRRKRHA